MTPTSAPTGGPTAGEITGDPHVTNVEGQRFNLVRVGVHTLLRLPRFSDPRPAQSALPALLEVLGTIESEKSCEEPFVRQLDLNGLWLRQSGPLVLRAGGLNEDSKGAIMLQVNGSHVGVDELSHDARLRGLLQVTKAKTKQAKPHGGRVHRNKFFTVKLHFSGATLTVDWVHREVPGSTLNHLDLHVADLPRLEKGMDVGGILGRDDHTLAASSSPGCEPAQNLMRLDTDLDVFGSLLKASYEK
jgi:hypothetical protein